MENKKRKFLIPIIPVLLLGIAGASLGTVAWFEATRNIIAGDSDKELDVKPSAVDLGDIRLYLVVDEDTSKTTMDPIELTDNNGDRWSVIKVSDKYYYQKISTTKAEGVTFGKLGLKVVAKKGMPEQDVTLNDLKPYNGTTLTYNITPGDRTRIALTNDSAVYAVAAETANFAFTVTINATDSLSYAIKNPSSVVQDTIYYSVAGKFPGSIAGTPTEGGECPSTDVDEAGTGEGIGHVYINGQRSNATMKYGEYPQSVVSDSDLISILTAESNSLPAGSAFTYQGQKYEKFTNKDSQTAFGVFEPIEWNILSIGNGEAFLASKYVLDAHAYNSNGGSSGNPGNNYANSDIRAWLNEDFLNTAFEDKTKIKTTTVDNSLDSTCDATNPYWCEDTEDRIFLLSRRELCNPNYGFSADLSDWGPTNSRICKITDFSRARGTYGASWNVDYLNNGHYWTRSPRFSSHSDAWNVDSNGNAGVSYYVSDASCGVRPALVLSLE